MSSPSDSTGWWREIVREQAHSGLSVAAYCRRTRVPQSSFYAWRRKLRGEGESSGGRGRFQTFAEVRVPPEVAGDAGALEVRLPRGRCIGVRAGFDRQTLLDLLSALEGQA
jgi:transposase-like protein